MHRRGLLKRSRSSDCRRGVLLRSRSDRRSRESIDHRSRHVSRDIIPDRRSRDRLSSAERRCESDRRLAERRERRAQEQRPLSRSLHIKEPSYHFHQNDHSPGHLHQNAEHLSHSVERKKLESNQFLDSPPRKYNAKHRDAMSYHSDYKKKSSVRSEHSASYTESVSRVHYADVPRRPCEKTRRTLQARLDSLQTKTMKLDAVILIDAKYPFLNDMQMDLVCKKILQDIDDIDDDVTQPRFESVKKEGSHLKVKCADSTTKRWLQRNVEKWPPLWNDKNSKLYVEDDTKLLRSNNLMHALIPDKHIINTKPSTSEMKDLVNSNKRIIGTNIDEQDTTIIDLTQDDVRLTMTTGSRVPGSDSTLNNSPFSENVVADNKKSMTESGIGGLSTVAAKMRASIKNARRRENAKLRRQTKIEGNVLPGSIPGSKPIPERKRSDDSQRAAADVNIRKTGNISYKDVASLPLNIAIIDEAQYLGKMTEVQVDLFREHLLSVVDTIAESDIIPTFNRSGLVKGHFMAECANEATKNWLIGRVAQWKPWPEAMLKVVQQDEVNNLKALVMFSTFIPSISTITSEFVLKRLQLQNPDINTESWRIVKMVERKAKEGQTKGTYVGIGMDQSCANSLTSRNNRVCYAMTQVTFSRHHPKEERNAACSLGVYYKPTRS